MQGNKSKNTAPELAVRRLVHAMGLRYRVNSRPLTGLRRTADLVFPRRRITVFIDGCYWHGCPQHYRVSKTNTDYWGPKIDQNRVRDEETNTALNDAGWIVLRFWEHEPPDSVSERIAHVWFYAKDASAPKTPPTTGAADRRADTLTSVQNFSTVRKFGTVA